MARLALELMLNIAARRTDAHKIGRQHMAFNDEQKAVLTFRPQKTERSTGKVLSIPVLPFLQEALAAMPDKTSGDQEMLAMAFLTNEYGRPFASARSFGGKFATWCNEAGLKPVVCIDGRVRNYRAHGLRKAALYSLAKLGASVVQLQAIGGHSSLAELQKYIQEIEQDEQAIGAMALVAAAQKAQIGKRTA
jgi:integrase